MKRAVARTVVEQLALSDCVAVPARRDEQTFRVSRSGTSAITTIRT